jgi:hypothetical protein
MEISNLGYAAGILIIFSAVLYFVIYNAVRNAIKDVNKEGYQAAPTQRA